MDAATSNTPVPVPSISVLPVEILDLILADLVAENRSAITTLMSVSRLWRDAITQQPLLWTTVELNLSRSKNAISRSNNVARRCIDRSASADLDITVTIQRKRSKTSCPCPSVLDKCAVCRRWFSGNRAVLEVLSGAQGEHLARWKRVEVYHEWEATKYHARWVEEVISPVLALGGTPRLRVLRLVGHFQHQIVLRHTPLLEDLAFSGTNDILIGDVSRVRKLAFCNTLPVHLSTALFTHLTHLILHIPILCSDLELRNVTMLDLIDNDAEELRLELPVLPRVQRISVVTFMEDFLLRLRLNHYPTWKCFCLRYYEKNPNLIPSDPFIVLSTAFLTSQCTGLEELDVDPWFIDVVKANIHRFSDLKRVLLSGVELERSSWYPCDIPRCGHLIDNAP
jgi:hypothetical protein